MRYVLFAAIATALLLPVVPAYSTVSTQPQLTSGDATLVAAKKKKTKKGKKSSKSKVAKK